MRPWLRTPATLPDFPRITAMAITGDSPAAGSASDRPPPEPVYPATQARHLQRLARRARSPYVLVHPAEATPSPGWLSAAVELLDAAPALACVSAGGDGREPLPTLCLETGAMLARRSALVDSGGLAPRLQGQGDGLDLAWRLWAMGQRVVSLRCAGTAPPARCPCSVYQATWSWLQILVRNCEEAILGRAFSAALLRLLAAAGEAADRTAVPQAWAALAPPPAVSAIQDIRYLRRDPAALHEPWYRVSRDVGETLVTLHDATLLLPLTFEERRQVQAQRRVHDAEIETQLGRPPLEIVEEQMAALSCSSPQPETRRAGNGESGDREGGRER